jgi:hypothetical protein
MRSSQAAAAAGASSFLVAKMDARRRPRHARLCSFDENERRGVISSTPRMCPRKGLWRGVGERPLRGLYSVLASSSIGHHQFREKRSARLRDKFGPAVEHKRLTKRSSFFFGRFFKHFARRAAKRERGHAPHASSGEQARRIRHSTSLPAPKARSGTAARAPFYVNSTNGQVGCQGEERW